MYDGVVKSYIRGEIDKETCVQMMWTMGASRTEMHFYLQEADKQRANKASSGLRGTPCKICGAIDGNSHHARCANNPRNR
jgi:hypothetical protein